MKDETKLHLDFNEIFLIQIKLLFTHVLIYLLIYLLPSLLTYLASVQRVKVTESNGNSILGLRKGDDSLQVYQSENGWTERVGDLRSLGLVGLPGVRVVKDQVLGP